MDVVLCAGIFGSWFLGRVTPVLSGEAVSHTDTWRKVAPIKLTMQLRRKRDQKPLDVFELKFGLELRERIGSIGMCLFLNF